MSSINIIDIETSGLNVDSYPIKVAVIVMLFKVHLEEGVLDSFTNLELLSQCADPVYKTTNRL